MGDDLTGGPAVNPAGTEVAVALEPSISRTEVTAPSSVPPSLWVIDVATGHRRLVVNGSVGDVAWNPDGTHLVFVEQQAPNSRLGVGVATVAAGGGPVHELVGIAGNLGDQSGSGYLSQRTSVSWSPDGRTVLVEVQDQTNLGPPGAAIVSMPAGGGPPTAVKATVGVARSFGLASYAPGGRHIVYTTTGLSPGAGRGQPSQLDVTAPDGSATHTLITSPEPGGIVVAGWLAG